MAADYRSLLPAAFTPFPRSALEGNILDRFQLMVMRHGARIAIVDQQQKITYEKLNADSDTLACRILREQASSLSPVVMLYRHGVSYNIAQLALLKAGKCHASLDETLPLQRLSMIIGDLDSELLLCDDHCEAVACMLREYFPRLRVLNTSALDLDQREVPAVPPAHPQDLACIVYTSGSTGVPRGVMLTHQNILHFTRNHSNAMHLSEADKATQLCPLWTGASAAEIFPVLLNGGTLYPFCLRTSGVSMLADLLCHGDITMLSAVPSLFRLIVSSLAPRQSFNSLRMLRLAGERVTRVDFDNFRRHCPSTCLLRVGLGASEVMMYAHHFLTHDDQPDTEILPVGFPLEDLELLLLDDDGKPVLPGQCGEIVVLSAYLSPGYWQDSVLTWQRFRQDPHDPDKRLYLSRDLGWRDVDGCLHHVGRKDSRIKINGKMFRLHDVEEALMAHEAVAEAVVLPLEQTARPTVVLAFIVASDSGVDVPDLRANLACCLPAEIVPREIHVLQCMPLNANGKIDRQALLAACTGGG